MRNVVLFGAGSAISWGGPSTFELTELTLSTGFNCCDNKTRITKFLFDSLLSAGYRSTEITFETIINLIEELIVYYSPVDSKGKTPSLLKVLFSSHFEDKILNYSVVYTNENKSRFRLQIPKNVDYVWQHLPAFKGEAPEQCYFQLLLIEILTSINARVSKYAYHTGSYSVLLREENQTNNALFLKWLESLKEDSGILRFYTLNYDRNFKILSLRAGITEMFEGFDCGETIEPETEVTSNIRKIINDFDCHCYYNLHGSAFWEVESRDYNLLPKNEILLRAAPQLQINSAESSVVQIENGRSLLISNIITGSQKASKKLLSPYRQMFSAFDKDCTNADKLFIIGYSFGDEHINLSIKTAIEANLNLKIYIVDPIYNEDENSGGYDRLQVQFMNVFSNLINNFSAQKVGKSIDTYFNGKVTVFSISMTSFLEINGAPNPTQ
jgi:hypothetical protein